VLALVRAHAEAGGAYLTYELATGLVEPELAHSLAQRYEIVPRSLVFQAVPRRRVPVFRPVQLRWSELKERVRAAAPGDLVRQKVLSVCVRMLCHRGPYLVPLGRRAEAEEALRASLRLDSAFLPARLALALLEAMGRRGGP